MIYAQLNEDNIVVCLTETSGMISGSNIVAVHTYDMSLLGKKYENDTFVDVPVVIPDVWQITKFAFKNRFPREKWKAARALIPVDADIADFFEDIEFAKFIDLKYPQLVAGINALGLQEVPENIRLTSDEIDAILNVPCQPGEEV